VSIFDVVTARQQGGHRSYERGRGESAPHPLDATTSCGVPGLRWSLDGVGSTCVETDIEAGPWGSAGEIASALVALVMDLAGIEALRIALGRVAAQNVSVTHLSSAPVGPIRAIATPERMTKEHGIANVKVHDLGRDGELVALGVVTARRPSDRERGTRDLERPLTRPLSRADS
jgi:hypothetical protein